MKLKSDLLDSVDSCNAIINLLDVLEDFKVPLAEQANTFVKTEIEDFCEFCENHLDDGCDCNDRHFNGRYAEYDDEASYDEA